MASLANHEGRRAPLRSDPRYPFPASTRNSVFRTLP